MAGLAPPYKMPSSNYVCYFSSASNSFEKHLTIVLQFLRGEKANVE
jgi:hypothetical protein